MAMEMEYKDPSRRGRWIVLLGVVLALVAGGAAFFLINNAQQKASTTGLKTVSGYVAARPILAKKPIVAEDIVLRADIPLDGTNEASVVTDSRGPPRPPPRRRRPPRPAPHDQPPRLRHRRPGLLDPAPRRDRRARLRGLARRGDHGVRRPRGRRRRSAPGMNVDVFVTATVGVEAPAGPVASARPGAVDRPPRPTTRSAAATTPTARRRSPTRA